jgi:hypothetical protein
VSPLARALLDELGPEDLRELARRLQPFLPTPAAPTEDRWLDTHAAAAYAGRSEHVIHKARANGDLEFEQPAGPRGKCMYKRSKLDAWMRGE